MSKQMYEEAIADVKKVKQVAEDSAKRAIIEAVTPRIRELIESQLLKEVDDDDDFDDVSDAPSADIEVAAAITAPDEEGKVTLDLDALNVDDSGVAVDPPMFGEPAKDSEYELSVESIEALAPILNATKTGALKDVELQVYHLKESVDDFKLASEIVKRSAGYQQQIAQIISRVENMYGYVQESVSDLTKKNLLEAKLETCFSDLELLKGQKMLKNKKNLMKEGDVTLKLTGLPDDLDLDSVGVDLITGEDDDQDSDGSSDDGDSEGGDDLDLDDLDMGGDDNSGEEESNMGENRRLGDDVIVEIDAGMLRREIARMRSLREEAAPSTAGTRPGSKEADDFGGGHIEGESLDVDIEASFEPLGESDEMDESDGADLDESDDAMDEADDMDESDAMEESDGLDQLGNRRKGEAFGSEAAQDHSVQAESLKRRLSFEKRLQERAKVRAGQLKREAKTAKAKGNSRALSAARKEYSQTARRFNESVARTQKISKLLAESAGNLRKASRSNSSASQQAGSNAVNSLRKKLAETNLNNTKLLYTNKLLQNESLTRRQKVQIIERLDEAKSDREAKLIYESISKTLSSSSNKLSESAERKVIGSGSRATRPASTPALNEGYEAERWAKLAGIVK